MPDTAAAEPGRLGRGGSDGRGAPVRGFRPGPGRRPEAGRRRLAVGALDETGQEKAGTATAGVRRQHMGCAGGVENGINTVRLSYVRQGTGHALTGARQWIPAEQIADPVRSLVTGLR